MLLIVSFQDEDRPVRVSLPGVSSVACGWLHTLFVVKSNTEQAVARCNDLGFFAMLPRDLMQHLFKSLDAVALSKLSCCNSVFSGLCSTDDLWKTLYLARNKPYASSFEAQLNNRTWKLQYINKFGPLDRPVTTSRWGISAFRPIQVKELIKARKTQQKRTGVDVHGRRKEGVSFVDGRIGCGWQDNDSVQAQTRRSGKKEKKETMFILMSSFFKVTTIPTIGSIKYCLSFLSKNRKKIKGFNVETVQYKNAFFTTWDV